MLNTFFTVRNLSQMTRVFCGWDALKILGAVFILFFTIQYADAVTPQYGIALSKSCLVMLTNNITTVCPTYDEIMVLFPDTTNKRTSGDFIEIDSITQRGKPQFINPQRLYDLNAIPVTWIDPPSDVRSKIIMITIHPSIPEFKIGGESIRMDDYNIKFGKDRWVHKYCRESNITAENWVYLTGDTMNLLKHNCDPSFTSFDGTVTLEFEKKYQNIATSSKYKLSEFVKMAKEKYKVSHIGSNDMTENKSVIEDEDE